MSQQAPPAAAPRFVLTAVIACVCTIVAIRGRAYVVDDGFIFLRFAHNVREGAGWSFNPGQPINATTSPLWTLLLIPFERAIGQSVPLFVGAYALFCGLFAIAIAELSRPLGGVVAAAMPLVVLVEPTLWQSTGLETSLFLATVAWTVVAHRTGRRATEGVLMGLAVLARPDAALLAAILVGDTLHRERRVPWRTLLGAIVVAAPWFLFATLRFGGPAPTTLGAKLAQSTRGWWATQPPFAVAAVDASALGVAGVFFLSLALVWNRSDEATRGLRLFLAFGVAHVVAYTLLRVPTGYVWYYAPYTSAAAIAAPLAIRGMATTAWATRWRLRAWAPATVAAVVIGLQCVALARAPVRYRGGDAYRAAGAWIAAHTPPRAVVAATEIGYLGHYSERPILDLHGLIHPEAARALRAEDATWWTSRDPATIVTHRTPWYAEPHAESASTALNAWFDARYARAASFGEGAATVDVWTSIRGEHGHVDASPPPTP